MIIISSSIISISITLLILKFSGCSYCELSFASTLVTIILLALIAAPLQSGAGFFFEELIWDFLTSESNPNTRVLGCRGLGAQAKAQDVVFLGGTVFPSSTARLYYNGSN